MDIQPKETLVSAMVYLNPTSMHVEVVLNGLPGCGIMLLVFRTLMPLDSWSYIEPS